MIFMTQRKLKLPRRCSPPAGRTRGSVPDSLCCCHFMLQSVVKTNGYMKRSVNRGSTEDAEDEVHQYREQNPEQEPQERDIENSQTRRSRARSRSSRSSRGAPTVKLVEVEHVVEVHEAAGEHHMLTVRMRISTAKTPNVEQRVVELKRQGVKKVRAGNSIRTRHTKQLQLRTPCAKDPAPSNGACKHKHDATHSMRSEDEL